MITFIILCMIFFNSKVYIFGKPSIKSQEHKPRYLEEDNYDSYAILYFKEDCNYSEGFKNEIRNGISFIFNRENGKKLTREESFIAHKGFGIEIHFKIITTLEAFFSSLYDDNMEYLISIDLSNFNTSSVTTMESMFFESISLEYIDFSNINTSSTTTMESMFYGCISLKSIDLSNFDTSSVTHMGSMFYNCDSLKSLNLSNFNISSVLYMGAMFSDCSSLKSIDLSSFGTSLVIIT